MKVKFISEDAYSSGYLVLSHLGFVFVLMLRPFCPELVISTDLLSFEHPSVLLFCSFYHMIIPKITIFPKKKKVKNLRKFHANIALKRRALRDVIRPLPITSLAKKREIGVKSVQYYWHNTIFTECKRNISDRAVGIKANGLILWYDWCTARKCRNVNFHNMSHIIGKFMKLLYERANHVIE